MSAARHALGDRLRVAHTLGAADDVTQARIDALLGVVPDAPEHGGAPSPWIRDRLALEASRAAAKADAQRAAEAAPQRRRWRPASRSWVASWQVLSMVSAILSILIASLVFTIVFVADKRLDVWILTLLPGLLAGLFGVVQVARQSPVAARIVPQPAELSASSAWLTDVPALDEHPPPDSPIADPPVDPLLAPRGTRGILTMALVTDLDDGALDTDRLVDAIARGAFPPRLPRRPHRSLSAGVQLLVDLSPTMLPYRTDLVALIGDVHRVVGKDRVSVLRFAGDPWHVGPGRRTTWAPFVAPQAGQPVLAVTDLGLGTGGSATTVAWLRLARALDHARCPLIALTPQPATAIPPRLRRAIAVVEWDRATTAASAARAVRGRRR